MGKIITKEEAMFVNVVSFLRKIRKIEDRYKIDGHLIYRHLLTKRV